MIRRLPFLLICFLLIGCGGDSPDVNLERSTKTLDEVQAYLKSGMTTDELHDFLNTTPALVTKNRFHWMVKDASIWTDFELRPEGAVIVNVFAEKVTPE